MLYITSINETIYVPSSHNLNFKLPHRATHAHDQIPQRRLSPVSHAKCAVPSPARVLLTLAAVSAHARSRYCSQQYGCNSNHTGQSHMRWVTAALSSGLGTAALLTGRCPRAPSTLLFGSGTERPRAAAAAAAGAPFCRCARPARAQRRRLLFLVARLVGLPPPA